MTLTTPSPNPASFKICPIKRCVAGQASDAFNTTVLPQASGIAKARVGKITGAFHGAIPTTTPHGTRIPIARLPGTSEGIRLPSIWVVMAAASRNILAARCTLNPYQVAVDPVSCIPI